MGVFELWHAFSIMVGTESSFFNTGESNYHRATRVRKLIISNSEYNTYHVNNAVKGSKCLRVLKVDSSYFPSGFLKVTSRTNLTYLFLNRNGSLIGNLKSLLTLNIRHVRQVKFPNEMWRMTHLRHIRLHPFCETVKVLRKLDVPFSNLQTLKWVPPNAMEVECLRGLPNLRKLGICFPTNSMIKVLSDVKPISDKLVSLSLARCHETSMDLSRYQSLCKLHVHSYRSLRPRSIVMPPNLVKLTFCVREISEDPMEIWKGLPKLKIFKLTVVEYERGLMVCSGGAEAFPQLEVLELDTCDHLFSTKSSLKVVVEEHAMPKLKRLTWEKSPRRLVHLRCQRGL